MPLDATQRSFLNDLGVVARKKKILHIRSPEEERDDKIIGVTDDYLRREAKVLEGVNALGQIPGTGYLAAELEQEVSAIQKRVTGATREQAASVIKAAYDSLDAVKDRARGLAKAAGANAEFFAKLDVATSALAALEQHAQRATVAKPIETARTGLASARANAKDGRFADAGNALATATVACAAGTKTADDFAEFYKKVPPTTAKLEALQKHLRKADIATQIATAENELKAVGEQAVAGNLPLAEAALGRADAACTLGKQLADVAFKVALAKPKLEDLRKNPQRAHIADKIGLANTKFLAAEAQIRAGDPSAAQAALTEAETACTDGKRFADGFAEVVRVKADTARIVAAMAGKINPATVWQAHSDNIAIAAAKADPPARDYAGAKADLGNTVNTLKGYIKAWYVDSAADDLKPATDKATELYAYLPVKPGATVIQGDIDNIMVLQQQVAADFGAGRWGQAVMTATKLIPEQVTNAVKLGNRRLEYDKQRARTVANVDGLKTKKSLLGQVVAMQNLLARADGLASRESMRMEDGIAELQKIDTTCTQLVSVAADAEGYLNERLRADNGLAGLRQSQSRDGRDAIAPQLASIETLLLQAQKATGVIDAASAIKVGLDMEDHFAHAQDWGDARKLVARAQAEIDAANGLAANLEDTVATKASIDKAGDAPKVAAAADALRKQAETAKSQPHADLADHEFTHIFLSLDEALAQAKAGRIDIAKVPLEGAADLLITAKTVQTEHTRFAAAYKAIDDRRNALNALTDPPAAQLAGKISPIGVALAEATKQDAARDWANAGAALRTADAAAKEAEELRDLRKKFNADATALELRNATLAEPLKGKVAAMIAKARGEADKFDLNYATRYLENAEAQVEGDTVAKLATNPDDPRFLAAIKKMLAARGGAELAVNSPYDPSKPREVDPTKAKQAKELPGGAELLDQIVAKFGDGASRAEDSKITRAIAIIAQERFGVDLAISVRKSAGGGEFKEVVPVTTADPEVKVKGADIRDVEPSSSRFTAKRSATARKMYELMARVPEQAENNPSMKRFERQDAYKANADGTLKTEGASGGFYRSSDDIAVMSGRTGVGSKQKFGAALQKAVRESEGLKEQLPPPVDPVYAPADDAEIDYFDFASAHELGHAVDDRMGFMASREGDGAFGGWKVYGGAIEPIAKAVSDDVIGKNPGASADAVKQFVTDLLTGAKPDKPAVEADKQASTDAACDAATAWHAVATNGGLWYRQPDSAQAAVAGTVYQEAYGGTWVSYPLAERAKGITGYQFRAPGEWFAELFAAYQMGKLKNGHPARRWLSSLSL